MWAIAEGRKCARVVDRYLIGLRPAEPPLEPEEAFEPHTGELEMPSDAYGASNGATVEADHLLNPARPVRVGHRDQRQRAELDHLR